MVIRALEGSRGAACSARGACARCCVGSEGDVARRHHHRGGARRSGVPAMTSCDSNERRQSCHRMRRRPARRQAPQRRSCSCQSVSGFPSGLQKTRGPRTCRMLRSAASSAVVSGTLRSLPLFVGPTIPFVQDRRKTTSLLCKSRSCHSNASCSPARAPVWNANMRVARSSLVLLARAFRSGLAQTWHMFRRRSRCTSHLWAVGSVALLALPGCASHASTRGATAASLGSALGGDGGMDSASGPRAGDRGVGWETVPSILSRIVAPTFPNVDCDVTHYGGVGDGTTDNTGAFAKAIADCAARGGGRVVVPAGTFFTGPIEPLSNSGLDVSRGATIRFSTDATKYLPVVKVSWEGSLAYNYHPLLWAHDATDVAITGPGTIDGNASAADWYAWSAKEGPDQTALRMQNANGVPPEQRIDGAGHYLRPGLIEFISCTNVLFEGFTATNSPFWTIHPVLSKNITARGFHALGSFINTDGFNPEACTDVLVNNATLRVADDAIAIKAGRDRDGWTYYRPTRSEE